MKSFGLGTYALSGGVSVALLAGCGGSQPPIGAPRTMPQTSAIATHADRGTSWMLPEAKDEALLYADDPAREDVFVFAYPKGTLLGTLTGFNAWPNGLCIDAYGHVFITTEESEIKGVIYEYNHGGTAPIASLSDEG